MEDSNSTQAADESTSPGYGLVGNHNPTGSGAELRWQRNHALPGLLTLKHLEKVMRQKGANPIGGRRTFGHVTTTPAVCMHLVLKLWNPVLLNPAGLFHYSPVHA